MLFTINRRYHPDLYLKDHQELLERHEKEVIIRKFLVEGVKPFVKVSESSCPYSLKCKEISIEAVVLSVDIWNSLPRWVKDLITAREEMLLRRETDTDSARREGC